MLYYLLILGEKPVILEGMERTTKRRGRKNRYINPDDLPNRVRPLREAKGLTLRELAAAAGIRTKSSIAEFELTGLGLMFHKQFRLADALGVDMGTMLTPGKNFAEKIRQSLDNVR